MSRFRPAPRRLAAVGTAVLLVSTGLAATGPAASAAPRAASPASQKALVAGRYLVTLADEPAATYEGTVKGFARTRPDAGKKLDPTRTEVVSWRSHLTSLHDSLVSKVGATKLADYTVATNGFAADLTAAQARTLSGTAGVVALEKDSLRTVDATPQTDYDFLGLPATGGLWSQLGGGTTAGQGVIVGVIDTGIWPESPSFAGAELKRDKAGLPVEATGLRGRWFGACVQGELFSSQNCNDKLIGARFYVAGFGKQNIAKGEYLSPRDGEGHGSHTASTAAGNRVSGVQIDGTSLGTVSGMAPGADVAAYKVCWTAKPGASTGCFNSDSVSAIDDAVADGVDVLNYSVGGSSESSPLDVVEQAFRRAARVGIFVANSAGNSGPGASTLDHPSPWLTTVAASTYQVAEHVVLLGDGQRFVGASTTGLLGSKPFISSVAAKLASATDSDAALCAPGTLDPAKVTGKIVQCDRGVVARIDKSYEVKRAGGVGMVMTNKTPNSLNGDFHPIPSVHLPDTDRPAILTYLGTAKPTASIVDVLPGESTTRIPEVADFSSRGPSTTTGGDILKPDLSAPGVDVLAAVAPPFNHGRSYDYLSGTSMSSPHVAGLGALIKALHPTWSPAAVKSSLMTTARDHVSTQDPFAQGAGFVDPNRAADPGLVFDATPDDYRRYMVGLGVQFAPPYDTLTAIDPSDLNQASIAIGALAGKQTVTRTITNVSGAPETYKVSSSVPGITVTTSPAGDITVNPGTPVTLSIQFTTGPTATLGSYAKGTYTLASDKHSVRIPVAVRPVAVAAPEEITGTGTSGTKEFSVTPGFAGTLVTSVSGLVAATPVNAVVANGPFAPGPDTAATKSYTLTVDPGTKLARFDVDAVGATDDLDLYVYKDGKLVDLSASAAGDEQVTLTDPDPGVYTAYVNGYDTANGGAFAFTKWAVAATDLQNLTVTGNKTATVGDPLTLTATWSGLTAGQRYLGFVGYAGSPVRTVVSIG